LSRKDAWNADSLPAKILVEDVLPWGWFLWHPANSKDKVVMVERPALGRAARFQVGSSGQVRAPCPITVLGADDLEPMISGASSTSV
jgi:hypothetical protein